MPSAYTNRFLRDDRVASGAETQRPTKQNQSGQKLAASRTMSLRALAVDLEAAGHQGPREIGIGVASNLLTPRFELPAEIRLIPL